MPTTTDLLKRLLQEHGRRYAPQYALAIVCMLLVAGATSLSAYALKYVIDTIFVHQDRAALVGITFGIVAIFVVKGFSAYFSEVVVGTTGNKIVAETQKRMFDHLLKVDLAFFEKYPSGDLVTRITYNAGCVRDVLNMVALNIGRDVFTIVGLVGTMVVLDPFLTLIALVGGPVAAISLRKMVVRIKKAMRSELHSMVGIVQGTRELSQGAYVVKSFQLEPALRSKMFAAIEAVERLASKMLRIQASVNPLMETLGGIAVAAVIFYAGWRNLYHGETPGQFFAFITALLMCADPGRRLSKVQLQMATAAVGVRLMYELLDAPAKEDEPAGKPDLMVSAGHIQFKDVVFSYVKNKPVLDNLDIEIPSGKTTALVGQSGGGKSTILALLQRIREPKAGAIRIDGQNIADVSLRSLRRNIAFVGQDSFLFEGSVLQNIQAGGADASTEKCVDAAKAASADEFITGLPQGYDTQVGELGSQVSGGQRQRIALARAYLKEAPIILLDEPTSALDSETEEIIQTHLKRLTKGKTTLVIAHRLSTVLHADLIHVVEAGKVIESGSHDQLMKLGGAYSRLFRLQFGKYAHEPAHATAV
ncbi:MAG TPA: ABC transporter ATP-binding protein [Hyphomicrobium sp.]|jgi:ATP-binding cassette subfamily B protein|nr:ABC transporter ATP-binding protein [Hyphomicrobium sp.]